MPARSKLPCQVCPSARLPGVSLNIASGSHRREMPADRLISMRVARS